MLCVFVWLFVVLRVRVCYGVLVYVCVCVLCVLVVVLLLNGLVALILISKCDCMVWLVLV